MSVETLPLTINHEKWELRQLGRSDHAAIYSMHIKAGEHKGRLDGYEVVKIRIAPASQLFGVDQPEREVYPTTDEWSERAWTFTRTDLDRAQAKFNRISRAAKAVEAQP